MPDDIPDDDPIFDDFPQYRHSKKVPERWLPAPGFLGYIISSEGRVRELGSPLALKTHKDRQGRAIVHLRRGDQRTTSPVWRLVREAFYPNDTLAFLMSDVYRDGRLGPGLENPPIVCRETGDVYMTAAECARELGLTRSGVLDVLAGRRRSSKGFSFEYMPIKFDWS